jgi:mannose-6-phosphate isomerase-like protein (cupin superfamily)
VEGDFVMAENKGRQAIRTSDLTDYGPEPFVADIGRAAAQNPNFRTALWSGAHLQVTLMSIPAGGEIGLELHPEVDQLLCIASGTGLALMGREKTALKLRNAVSEGDVIIIPAKTWHNVVNTGSRPLKLFSVYAPPQHPHGTVHKTKAEADASEK